MDIKRIASIVLIVVGAGMMYMAHYIRVEVNEGKGQVSSAQKKVDTANSLFSQNQTTKKIGQGLTSPIQKRINEGKGQISDYEKLATVLNVAGIIFVIGGAGALFLQRKRKRS